MSHARAVENKISSSSFANRISYSGPNEDSRSELRALSIGKDDVVLCVTGGGDRVLNLLLGNPKKIIAIDLNPNQNHLLELKIAGIKKLSHRAFLEFLGILVSEDRMVVYNKIKHLLSKDARDFWDKRACILSKGVFYEGTFEKYFRIISIIFKILRPEAIKELVSFTSLDDQRAYVTKKWNTLIWKLFLRFITNKYFFKFLLKDPGFYEYVPQDLTVSEYLISRMDYSLMNHLVADNFFMTFLLTGKYNPDKNLPPYLQKENYDVIKELLNLSADKIELVTKPLGKYLSNTNEVIDKFSLSDVSAYLSENEFLALLKAVYSAGSSKSIFCLRHFITKRKIPDAIKNKYKFDECLEDELGNSDVSFVYSFKVGSKVD